VKVALICDWYRPRIGGIETHLEGLSQRLIEAGHDVVVITPTRGESTVAGIRVHRISAPIAPYFKFLTTRGGIRAIGDALERERVDVAHSHVSIISPAALGGAVEAERRGLPSVVTFHSVVPRTDLLARAVRMALRSDRWNARFTAVSQRVAREVQAVAGAHSITLLPNGIDTSFWRGAERTTTRHMNAPFELVSVMRLNHKKRPLALVGIIADARDLLDRSRGLRLRIVGDGPQRAALERAIQRANLENIIEVLGERTREEVRSLLANADAFLLPTVRESFGLAALEARCVGLPVIAVTQSGVAEIVEDGHEGLLGRDDAELAAHVARLAADRFFHRSIVENNRATPTPHDWPRVVATHEAVYREAIALRDNVRAEMHA
jgi:glycosyltransferase involved in cell wall biosynthesis